MTKLAETRLVTMRFGSFTAVDSASLTVGAGEVVGLLGANGAGKTTLIRLVLGLVRPSEGDVALFGAPPSRTTRRRIGYVPQSLGLYDDLTVEENWMFTASAFGSKGLPLPPALRDVRDRLVRTLPLGLQRRVGFAVAFSHQPALLVLDEPTSGVGPLIRTRLWEDIRDSAEQGVGVLVTTHNMEEAEQCDRLVVMAGGRVVAEGTVAEVIGDRHVIEARCDSWQEAFFALDAEGLIVQVQGNVLRVPGSLEDVVGVLARHHLRGEAVTVPANLEEAFVSIVAAGAAR